jgi:hypothetical protein
MLTEKKQHINRRLIECITGLDIPPGKYKEAMERYGALKEHLEEGNYPKTQTPPEVFMQGSFKLGTVIRPYKEGKDADYDIDVVCRLDQEKDSTEPENLKNGVGAEVKTYARKNSMKKPENKRRCWVLEYAPDSNGIGFHMDVLPCVHDQDLAEYISREDPTLEQYASTTVAITNRDDDIDPPEYDWRSGNPHGYAKWFRDVNYPSFVIFEREQKRLLFESNRDIYGKEQDVPNELIRTPLQRTIQILKRHRDVHFAGHKWEKHKPISMIITTLAGRLYEGKASSLRTVYDTLIYIVEQLIAHAGLLEPMQYLSEEISTLKLIQRVGDRWYIPNPVNPHLPGDPEDKGENFADRWHEDNHAGARAFFEWLRKLNYDFEKAFNQTDIHEMEKDLGTVFGAGIIEKAFDKRFPLDNVKAVPVEVKERPKSWGHKN